MAIDPSNPATGSSTAGPSGPGPTGTAPTTYGPTSVGGSLSGLSRRFGGPASAAQQAQEAGERRTLIGKLFDRVAPHSLEAEMGLLGSMLLDPRVISDVLVVVKNAQAFYLPAHAEIFDAITTLADTRGTVDPLLLFEKLRDSGALERCGGPQYIEKLAVEVPTAVNAKFFAQIVADKHKLRRLIDAAGDILFKTYNAQVTDAGEVKRLIDEAEQAIFNIAQAESISDIESLEQLLVAEFNRLMAIESGQIVQTGVMSGFADLDRDTTGFHAGEMLVLAARPSMGKTAFLLNMAEQIALGTDTPGSTHASRAKVPIGIFSLEMSRDSLAQRLLASWSGISSQKIRSGQLSRSAMNDEHGQLLSAANVLSAAPIFIDDTPGLTLMGLRARARRMVTQYQVKIIMIDYLQLLSSPQGARESRQAEVGQISRGIKELARELKVPIIALSQLNRNSEGRDGNRPRISDLRESGSIEQDADMVMLLHREEYYHIGDPAWMNDPANADKIGVAELIIAKQRNGPTGTVKLSWDANTTRFKSLSPHGDPYYGPGSGGGGGGGGGPKPNSYDTFNQGPAATGIGRGSAPAYDQGDLGRAPMVDPFADDPFDDSPRPPAGASGPARGGYTGGFHPGKKTGPIANHRDGGGPDRDGEPDTGSPRDNGASPAGPSSEIGAGADEFGGDDVAPF